MEKKTDLRIIKSKNAKTISCSINFCMPDLPLKEFPKILLKFIPILIHTQRQYTASIFTSIVFFPLRIAESEPPFVPAVSQQNRQHTTF